MGTNGSKLDDLPEKPIKAILEYLPLKEKFALREVCRDLCNTIDKINVDIGCHSIGIELVNNQLLTMMVNVSGKLFYKVYEYINGNQCLVDNKLFLDGFLQMFECHLKQLIACSQPPGIRFWLSWDGDRYGWRDEIPRGGDIIYSAVLDHCFNAFFACGTVKIHGMSITVLTEENLIKLWNHMDSDLLKKMKIKTSYDGPALTLSQLCDMDHWKNLTELTAYCNVVTTVNRIEHLHISTFRVQKLTVTDNEDYLKVFVACDRDQNFVIYCTRYQHPIEDPYVEGIRYQKRLNRQNYVSTWKPQKSITWPYHHTHNLASSSSVAPENNTSSSETSMKKNTETSYLLNIPKNLVGEIISHLSMSDKLNVRLVCSAINSMESDILLTEIVITLTGSYDLSMMWTASGETFTNNYQCLNGEQCFVNNKLHDGEFYDVFEEHLRMLNSYKNSSKLKLSLIWKEPGYRFSRRGFFMYTSLINHCSDALALKPLNVGELYIDAITETNIIKLCERFYPGSLKKLETKSIFDGPILSLSDICELPVWMELSTITTNCEIETTTERLTHFQEAKFSKNLSVMDIEQYVKALLAGKTKQKYTIYCWRDVTSDSLIAAFGNPRTRGRPDQISTPDQQKWYFRTGKSGQAVGLYVNHRLCNIQFETDDYEGFFGLGEQAASFRNDRN